MRPVTVTATLAGVGVVALGICVAEVVMSPGPGAVVDIGLYLLMGVPAAVLAVVLGRRRPGLPLTAMLMGVAVVPLVVGAGELSPAWVGVAPEWLGRALSAASLVVWPLWYLPLALLGLLFPTGRLPSPRWRWVVALLVIVVAGMPVASFVLAAVGKTDGPALVAAPLLLLPLLVASIAAPFVRYRRSGETERRQLRWLSLVGLTLPGTLMACWLGYLVFGGPEVAIIGLVVTYLAIPAGATVALLDDEMWDVDRVLAAAIAHLALTGAILALFTGVALVAGSVAPGQSVAAAVVATALCAAAALPLRVRLQRIADRVIYPARTVALQAVETLRRRSGEDDALPEQLAEALRTALGDPLLAIGYRVPGSHQLVDADGRPITAVADLVPVTLAGVEIGALAPGRRRSRQLLRDVARACAPVVEVVRLRLELRRALSDVEDSRARLLQVSYEERRRLERDLHDGAQQRLVSLGMALRLAQRQLTPAMAGGPARLPVDVDGVLDQAVAEISTAVGELRQVAHGIRPTCLEDGLPAALASLVEAVPLDVQLTVDLDAVPGRLPADIETTAYYVANEAVANAVKHAEAARIDLTLSRAHEGVVLAVTDDGRGGARADGRGLSGLDDRVRAHGGRLRVLSPAGGGTRVEALLPCAS